MWRNACVAVTGEINLRWKRGSSRLGRSNPISIHCENRCEGLGRRDVVQKFNVTAFVCVTMLSAAMSARPGVALSSETPEVKPPGLAALCEEAVVNPISGYAECVRPPGVPVEPPPPRPKVVKLAVFDFAMDDVSPAASL